MLGIGLGIDYGLLIVVSRFREERAAGLAGADAIERTVGTAGVTVAFSGLTVAVALSGLLVFDNDGLRSLAIGGIGVVLLAVVAARHAAAGPAGDGRSPHPAAPARRRRHGGFATIARRPASGGPGRAASPPSGPGRRPLRRARFEQPDARWLPRSSVARQLDEIRRTRFPDVGADPIEVVAEAAADDPALEAYVAAVGPARSVSVADQAVAGPHR